MKNKKMKIGALIVIVGLLATTGIAMTLPKTAATETVKTVTVENKDLYQTLKTDGVVKLTEENKVFAQNSGLIQKRFFEKGDVVEKGQVLFQLDTAALKEKLAQAKYTLSVDMDSLNSAKVNGNTALKASMDRAQAAYNRAQADYEANVALAQSGAISSNELEQSKSKLESADSDLKAAEEKYQSNNADAEIKKLTEKVALDKLSIQNIQTDIAKATVKAPVSGTLTDMLDDSQAFINSGTLVATIANLKGLQVESMVSEYDIAKIKLGQTVSVHTLGNTNQLYNGTVTKIDTVGTKQNEEVLVKVTIDLKQTDDQIKPNFTVSIDIELGSKSNAMTIPYEALVKKDNATFAVTVMNPETKETKEILVQKGFETDLDVEIISDQLKTGDTIVIPADKATAKEKEFNGGPGSETQNL